VTYQQRNFFDWGGWLATRPMDELPYWRVIMHRERDGHPDCDPRIRQMAREHADAIAEIRAILHERRIVNNRDFEMATRTRTDSYRGRKDSALALYYLWRTGEVMTHHRENFERVYALTETVAPAHLIRQSSQAETDRFLIKKEISFAGPKKSSSSPPSIPSVPAAGPKLYSASTTCGKYTSQNTSANSATTLYQYYGATSSSAASTANWIGRPTPSSSSAFG
jgi:hypothetical protein